MDEMEEYIMRKKETKDFLVYALTGITILISFFILHAFTVNTMIALSLSIVFGIVLLYISGKKERDTKRKHQLKKVSPEKEEFYKSKGLSKEDIQYFRETMHKAKRQIIQIEKNMNQAGKLKAIEHRNNTAQLAKSLFKEIIKEPNRLHEVDQFLYVHLPSLADLTEKYVEIDNHEKKSKATFDILEKSAETIDGMCQQIAEDYVKFKSSDIEDMDLEVKLAKRTLNKDNEHYKESIENDEV
jgi:5-bromo-4-chloroindolyl phosphate hydrolysis protein